MDTGKLVRMIISDMRGERRHCMRVGIFQRRKRFVVALRSGIVALIAVKGFKRTDRAMRFETLVYPEFG